MRAAQRVWTRDRGWEPASPLPADAQLVLCLGDRDLLLRQDLQDEIRTQVPDALFCACSTAGEIHDVRVLESSLVVTAVSFETTRVRGNQIRLNEPDDSREVGERLVRGLLEDDLSHVMVFSGDRKINGSALVQGMTAALPEGVTVTGGLAAGGTELGPTAVALDGPAAEGSSIGIGFYGPDLRVGYGSLGGWDPFGPERRITRSEGNALYELDGQSALTLYKRYLGDRAAELPSSALLFPLSLRLPDGSQGVVRTVLSIDEENQSMIFAGEMPEGTYARLMKANFERLIDGAVEAAQTSRSALGDADAALAILISCVGRRLVLQQRVEEEVEGVREILGPGPVLCGFYSLGEISPFTSSAPCELHNQTMTITTFSEL